MIKKKTPFKLESMNLEHNIETPTPHREDLTKEKELSLINDLENVIGGAVSEVIYSKSETEIYSYLLDEHLRFEELRQPMDGPEADIPSEIETFFLNRAESNLWKIEKLRKEFEKSQRPIQYIDETDLKTTSLYDYIPKDIQKEIKNQLSMMYDPKNLRESLENEIASACPTLWTSWKVSKKNPNIEEVDKENLSILIFGKQDEETERILKENKTHITKGEELAEVLAMERARMCLSALSSKGTEQLSRTHEAKTILGEDYQLIKKQVDHLNALLEEDWKKSGGGPIEHPTTGKELICPEIIKAMNDNPCQQQIDILEKAYTFMAKRKLEGTDDKKTKENRDIAFVLASMAMLSIGKKAKAVNTLSLTRQLSNPNLSEKERKELLERVKKVGISTFHVIKKLGKIPLKAFYSLTKATANGLIRHWPMIACVALWRRVQNDDKDLYGHGRENVSLAEELRMSDLNTIR